MTALWRPEQILKVISRLCRGETSDLETSQLVNLCVEMAMAYLKYLESTGRRIRETGAATEWRGLACDGIAELFARDADGCYPIFCRVFATLHSSQAPAVEWQMLLRRLVTRRMQQHLSRIYKERNPEGARLLRNIRLAALRLPNVVLRRNIVGLMLEYRPPERGSCQSLSRAPLGLLQATAAQVFRPRMTIDEMVNALLCRLFFLLKTPVYIVVEELIPLISEYRLRVQETEETLSLEIQDDGALQLAINAANRSLAVVEKSLIENYVAKGKLTDREALSLFSAVKETLLGRLAAQEIKVLSFADAIRRFWPELDEKRYRTEIRPMLDYIVKVYRKEMQRKLGDIL